MKPYYRIFLPVLMLFACGQLASAGPAAERFHEGSQYQRITPPSPLGEHSNKVEVIEMFFYACPHCYTMDAKMQQWLKDKPYIDFHRIPAIVGPGWADQARAFYIARALGSFEQLHAAMFKAIHEGGKQIYNESSVIDFFVRQGVAREKVLALYRSPEIAASVNEARLKTVRYGLRGVPAVIVNGKYKTAPYFVRDQVQMLEVLDSLVEKERAVPGKKG